MSDATVEETRQMKVWAVTIVLVVLVITFGIVFYNSFDIHCTTVLVGKGYTPSYVFIGGSTRVVWKKTSNPPEVINPRRRKIR